MTAADAYLQIGPAETLERAAAFADSLRMLDEKLRLRNQGLMRKLMTWGELLDAAGWCVALRWPGDWGFWLSDLAKRNLQQSSLQPSSWQELLDATKRVKTKAWRRREEGVLIWAGETTRSQSLPPAGNLTKRENEVMAWLREGKTTAEIAIILGCSARTVEKHLANLYRKIGVRTQISVILNTQKPRN